MYIKEADETLLQRKDNFFKKTLKTLSVEDIELWNKFNNTVKVEPSISLKSDRLFDAYKMDSLTKEVEHYRILQAPIIINNQPFTFVSKINLVENEDLLQSIALLFFILMSLLLGGMLFLTKILSVNLWKPFYKTLENIEQFEIDKTENLSFLNSEIEEFNRLNLSIEKLIEKNKAIYNSQKEFIENAAHELQTPIAVFKANIETLNQDKNITKEQATILSSLNVNIAKMNRLNKNLLLLSKIDGSHFLETSQFSVKKLLETILEFFNEQALLKKITIATNFKNDCMLNANKVLTEIVVSNLLMNAIRHNVEKGMVEILLDQNSLKISNSGVPTQLLRETLFNRFYKTNISEKGNGLGLAIVKKICDQNNWQIRYKFENNLHIFFIYFKIQN